MTRELLPSATLAQTRAAVRVLLRPHRGTAVGALVLLTASTGAGLLMAPLLGRIVDLVAEGRPADAVTLPVAGIAVAALVQGVLAGFGVSLVSRLGEGLLAGLRERFVERALHLPLETVERAGSGDLTSRVTNDVTVVAEGVRNALPQLARSALTIALTLVGMLALDWRLMLAALVAVPIQAHTVRWYSRRAIPLYAEQRVIAGAQQQQQLGTVGGAATVRAFGLAEEHLDQVGHRSRAVVEIALRGIRLVTRFYARLNLAEFLGLAAVLVTGFLLVRGGSVSIGTATAAALYFHGLFTPINIALGLVDDAQSSLAALARLVGVAELASAGPVKRPDDGAGAVPVRVRNADHAYVPGHEVLRGIDLDIAAGERVALVGASGAGKTTLAKLIAGLHSPSRGSVEVPGRVALVTQEVHVFAGTLAEDLRLARPDAAERELLAALERVGALEWAQALPKGLATVVGDGGHRLTAAQAQQLALARLVLADPPVVVLDEATAEAGSAGARMLETAALNATEGRTALVVAHRLTQAAAADRVVVMEDGRIVESGAHGELVGRPGGRYAALWEAWSGSRRT